jgi:DNA-binding protein YbaB
MTDMTGNLASAVIARITKQRDLVSVMHEHTASISARVTSRDKSVSVEVDGYGAMTGLWLADSSYGNGADALAKLIVQTADAAARVAQARQNHLLKEFGERMSSLQRAALTRSDGSIFQPDAPHPGDGS